MIHVYGVVDQLRSLPLQLGVGGAPLERARVGRLELVVSRTNSNEATREAVLAHAQVVDELMARSRAVLPVQFTAFADEGELADAVVPKVETLERALRRVRGCAEFGLRVAQAAVELPEASSGAEYMRARLAEEQRRQQVTALVHEPLTRLSRATARVRSSSAGVLESAYLVPVETVAAFRDTLGRLQVEHPELTIVCTGPWPAYSFGGSVEESEPEPEL